MVGRLRRTIGVVGTTTALGMTLTLAPPVTAAEQAAGGGGEDVGLGDLEVAGVAKRLKSGAIRLVGHRDDGLSRGSAYSPEMVDISAFTARLGFRFIGTCSDGIAVVIQADRPRALGGRSLAMGYGSDGRLEGVAHSLAVELDTWRNKASDFGAGSRRDPWVPHASVQSRGVEPNDPSPLYSLGQARIIPQIADGSRHGVKVRYIGGVLRVAVDREHVLELPVDIATLIGANEGTAYIGASAGGGACDTRVRIAQFRVDVTSATTEPVGLGRPGS